MQVHELVAQYTLQLEADGRSIHTLVQARRHGALVAEFFAATPVAEISHQEIARFLTSAMAMRTPDGRVKKPTSMNTLRSSVRTLFGFAHAAGYTLANPARLVRRARCAPPPPRALSEDDRTKLLRLLDQAHTVAERRDHALVHLLLEAGLRIGSALALDVGDVDLDAGEVRLRTMKNSDQDTAVLPRGTVAILRQHLAGRAAGPVFVGVHGRRLGARQAHRRLAVLATRAGLTRAVSPHCLRHTFGLALYRRTGDLLVTARAMCHRSIISTAVYARADHAQVRAVIALG
jgi:integrase/recombinase XerC